MTTPANAPLKGVRVLELARILAGPWAGQIMADLGADVIKVERPETGDDTRFWGPPFVETPEGDNLGAAYYHSCNRGKRSIAIDISSIEGQAKIKELVKNADVVLENYKVGGLKKYGLDYDSLKAINSRLIYCSVTGFGQTGPYAQKPGYDFIIQGMGGMMSITGEPDGPPQKGGVAYADLFTGVYSAVGVLAALNRRHVTGEGTHIDMALLDSMVGVLGNQALNWMVSGNVPHRMGNGHMNLAPYQSFQTADGDVIIAVGNDRQFAALCDVLDCKELANDKRFSTNPARVTNRKELIPLIEAKTREHTSASLRAALDTASVPVGPVNRIDEVFSDPQIVFRGMQLNAQDTEIEVPGVASPIVMDGQRMATTKSSPRLGEDEDANWLPR